MGFVWLSDSVAATKNLESNSAFQWGTFCVEYFFVCESMSEKGIFSYWGTFCVEYFRTIWELSFEIA